MNGDVEWSATRQDGFYPRSEIVATIGDFHITIYASWERGSRIIIETDDRLWFAAGQAAGVSVNVLKSRAVALVAAFEAIRGDMT